MEAINSYKIEVINGKKFHQIGISDVKKTKSVHVTVSKKEFENVVKHLNLEPLQYTKSQHYIIHYF